MPECSRNRACPYYKSPLGPDGAKCGLEDCPLKPSKPIFPRTSFIQQLNQLDNSLQSYVDEQNPQGELALQIQDIQVQVNSLRSRLEQEST